jgi:putative oxidoreductase
MTAVIEFVLRLRGLADRIGRSLAWLPPALARLGVGLVFAQSGWGKLHDLESVASFFTELGLPAPMFQAALVSLTELICGSMILLGLASRFAAVPLIVTMLVAIATALWPQVDSLASLFGLSETLYIVLLLWIATAGPGPISLDALAERVAEGRVPHARLRSPSHA